MSKKEKDLQDENALGDMMQESDPEQTESNLPIEETEEDTSSSLIRELEDQKEKYIRLLAEFENFKRRTARERIDLTRTAGQELIADLLPALDDIDRASQLLSESGHADSMREGLRLISDKIRNTLRQKGLQEMECLGTEFDSDTMEAITEIPAPDPKLVGKVVEVVQKGYTLNEKIIRYAKVIVGK